MRIKSELGFNTTDKSLKEQNEIIQLHLIAPILKEVKKTIRKKVIRGTNSNNQIIKLDLIILSQIELLKILKKHDGETANDIYLAITKEKQIASVEL